MKHETPKNFIVGAKIAASCLIFTRRMKRRFVIHYKLCVAFGLQILLLVSVGLQILLLVSVGLQIRHNGQANSLQRPTVGRTFAF